MSWDGTFTLPGVLSTGDCTPPNECDTFELTVDLDGGTGDLLIEVTQPGDLDCPGVGAGLTVAAVARLARRPV